MKIVLLQDVHVPNTFSGVAGGSYTVSEELGEMLIARGMVEVSKFEAMVDQTPVVKVGEEEKPLTKKSNK